MLLILLAGLLAYANSFSVPFLYDDTFFILDPRSQQYFQPLWKAFIPPAHFQPVIHRPLVTLSLAVNYALDGTEVWGYHAFNLAVHLLAALTLFAVLRRSFENPRLARHTGTVAGPLALTIALLWVAHPIHTGSVTFTYQRAEAMMGLFYLLTLYGVIRSAESPEGRRWKFFTVAVGALGMMSKQVMVTAPVLALVYDRIFLSDSLAQVLRRRGKLYLALTLTLLIPVFFFAISHHENPSNFGPAVKEFTPLQYILNQPGILLHYLRLAFWPHPLMLDPAWPFACTAGALLPPLLVITTLLAATAWALCRRPALGFLGFAFFLILSPICFISVGDPGADHRFSLALAPVLTLAVIGAHEVLRRRGRTGPVLAACAVAALTLATFLRNHDYRSNLSIWRDNVIKRPASVRAHFNLGTAYGRDGQYHLALEQFEIALRSSPHSAAMFCNTGAALFYLGQYEKAVAYLKAALELDPRDYRWHSSLGMIYLQHGDASRALEEFTEASRLEPDLSDVENNLGIVFNRQGKREEALTHFARAVKLQPDYAKGYHNLGVTLAQLGRLPEAAQALEKAYRLDESLKETDQKLVHDSRFQPGVAALQ